MKKDEVDKIGKGRVWAGTQAKELGLVDEIGGLSRAMNLAKELARIPADEAVKLVVWPKRLRLIDFLMGRRLLGVKLFLAPSRQEMLSTLELLDRDKILAIMPLWIKPE